MLLWSQTSLVGFHQITFFIIYIFSAFNSILLSDSSKMDINLSLCELLELGAVLGDHGNLSKARVGKFNLDWECKPQSQMA